MGSGRDELPDGGAEERIRIEEAPDRVVVAIDGLRAVADRFLVEGRLPCAVAVEGSRDDALVIRVRRAEPASGTAGLLADEGLVRHVARLRPVGVVQG